MIRPLPVLAQMDEWNPQLDFDESPLLCFYELTQACDLACSYCRACAQPDPHPDELTSIDSIRLIDQIAEFPDPPILVLTGGDPFKRRDLFAICEYASGMDLDVCVTPSATPLVTEAAIRRLRMAGISRLAISLDGADAGTHDKIRGTVGSFERSVEILKESAFVGLATQVNTTLTPHNIDQLDNLAELLSTLDIQTWSVFFLVPTGRAQFARRLSAYEYEAAFAKLWKHSQEQTYAVKTTEAPHYRRFVLEQLRQNAAIGDSCRSRMESFYNGSAGRFALNDGKGVMFVSHTGIVQPSGFLPIQCGRFPEEHLVDIYQNSPVFHALRDTERLKGKCGYCEYREVCGGSRARAFAVTGNMLSQEPDCTYVPRRVFS